MNEFIHQLTFNNFFSTPINLPAKTIEWSAAWLVQPIPPHNPFTYHMQLFAFLHFLAQLETGRHVHRFLNRQIGVQLVVLHDVGRQLAELAEVTFLSIHRDRTLDVCGPAGGGQKEKGQSINKSITRWAFLFFCFVLSFRAYDSYL